MAMKKVIAIISGVIIGFVMVFVGDATSNSLHPMPVSINMLDKAALLEYVKTIPLYVLIVLSIFWILSAFFGGMITGLLSKEQWKSASMTTGAILMAATLLNLIMTAPLHPLWMWVVTGAGYLPFALIGAWIVRRNDPPAPKTEA